MHSARESDGMGRRERRKNSVYSYANTICLYYLCSLFITAPIIRIFFPDQTYGIPYFYSSIGLLLIVILLFIRKRNTFSLSWIDIGWTILFLYSLPEYIKYGHLSTNISLMATYILARMLPQKEKVAPILMAGGILQVFLLAMQGCGILPSYNHTFPLTGSFNNPGPLGGYLAVSFIASIIYYPRTKKWLGISCLFLLGNALLITDSRAAWLGSIIAIVYIGMQRHRASNIKQILVYLSLVVFFGIISLTTYKTGSAHGRLVIWKVTINQMLREKPVTGNGYDSFRRNYMNHQAHYIQTHPQTDNNRLLTNNGYAFNEFLRIQYEQGIIGLLCILSILVLHCRTNRNATFLPCLLAFATFAFFSYPSDVFLLSLQAMLLSGSLPHPIAYRIKDTNIFRWATCTVCFTTLLVASYQYIQRSQLEKSLKYYIRDNHPHSLAYLRNHFTQFAYSIDFLSRYARILYLKEEYTDAIPALEQAIALYPTTEKYRDLGDMYRHLKKYPQAETAYLNAIRLLPHSIESCYSLYQLYQHTGENDKALQIAQQIQTIVPKKKDNRYREIIRSLTPEK